MSRIIRNQTRKDFNRRIQQIDPGFVGAPLLKPVSHRPFLTLLLGFVWSFLVIVVAQNRGALEAFVSPNLRDTVLMGIAAALLASITLFGIHLARMIFRSGSARANSRALLFGVCGALLITHMPVEVRDAGFGLLGKDAQTMLIAAGDGVGRHLPGVDFSAAVSVSSWGL